MIIRPTTQATNETMLGYIFANQNKYNEYSEQSSTGKRISTPSDDPIDASTILNINKKLSQLDGYLNNMETSQNELNVLDNSLASITKGLQKASDLAIQAASDTTGVTGRASVKEQIDQIIQGMVDVGNTSYNGTYIFAGTNTGTVPFQAVATGGTAYTGTLQTEDYERNIQIAEGVTTPINVTGDKVLGSYDSATGTGSGILKTLYDLSNALGSNDTVGIRNSIDQLSAEVDSTSTIRSNFAAITSRFELTTSSIESSITQLTEYKSSLEDVDIAEALTKLTNANVAYQASMQIASMTMNASSLLNYM